MAIEKDEFHNVEWWQYVGDIETSGSSIARMKRRDRVGRIETLSQEQYARLRELHDEQERK